MSSSLTFGTGSTTAARPTAARRHAPELRRATPARALAPRATIQGARTQYLETGACEAGVIGTPERLARLPDAAFDLGLALFEVSDTTPSAGTDPDSGPTPPGR